MGATFKGCCLMNQKKLTLILFFLITNLFILLFFKNYLVSCSIRDFKPNYSRRNYSAPYSPSFSTFHKNSVESIEPSAEILSSSTLEKHIEQKHYQVSIGYYNLKTKKSFYYRADKLYYGASLIKTLDAIYLYDKCLMTKDLEPYVQKAISKSDNASHHYLVNKIGKQNLKNYANSLGAKNVLELTDNYGNTTVYDQMIYLQKLYILAKTNKKLQSFFVNNYANYMKIDGVQNLHKYGYFRSYFHDVGIFLDQEPYLLIILTEHGYDDYKSIIRELSQLMHQYHLSLSSISKRKVP